MPGNVSSNPRLEVPSISSNIQQFFTRGYMPPPGKISLKEVSNCEYNDFSESVYGPVAIPMTASGK
jgi:hypothetical protein